MSLIQLKEDLGWSDRSNNKCKHSRTCYDILYKNINIGYCFYKCARDSSIFEKGVQETLISVSFHLQPEYSFLDKRQIEYTSCCLEIAWNGQEYYGDLFVALSSGNKSLYPELTFLNNIDDVQKYYKASMVIAIKHLYNFFQRANECY